MNSNTHSDCKISKFDRLINKVLEDEDAWNKKVKRREYKLLKKDNFDVKVTKIYRYFNEGGE